MPAHKSPDREKADARRKGLKPLPRFYSTLVNLERLRSEKTPFDPEYIREVRTGKRADLEVLDVLETVGNACARLTQALSA